MLIRKLQWAWRVLRSKSFVVLTDEQSVICVSGLDPDVLEDVVIIASQVATLEEFRNELDTLIRNHESALANFMRKETSDVKQPIKIEVN